MKQQCIHDERRPFVYNRAESSRRHFHPSQIPTDRVRPMMPARAKVLKAHSRVVRNNDCSEMGANVLDPLQDTWEVGWE